MKNITIQLLLFFVFFQVTAQDVTFTGTGNRRVAPYGTMNWNWNVDAYKKFEHFSPSDNHRMAYRLLTPTNNDPSKKYPLFVMLHGGGEGIGEDCYLERGDNVCPLVWGGKLALDSMNKYPTYAVFPQTSGAWWGNNGNGNSYYGFSDPMDAPTRCVFEIIDNLVKNNNIDPDRIYLGGLSAGGRAVWELLGRRPDLFASATPFCGMGNTYLAKNLINNPIWSFQGGKDANPNPFETKNMYDSLAKYGGNPKRSLYVDRDHWVWVDAYHSKTWLQWVYKQDKKNINVLYGEQPLLCSGSNLSLGISYGYTDYQWLLNGANIAGANAYVYRATTPGTYTVSFRRKDGSTVLSNPLVIGTKTCANGTGLAYAYYEGTFTALPNFAAITPKKTGTVTNVSLVPRDREDQFAFKYDGFIDIATAGQYTFFTTSDDGSKLFINGQQIVNNDFMQGATERSGTVTLTIGRKPISITYFDNTGGQTLEMRYQGPGISKRLIPTNVLFPSTAPPVTQSPAANAGTDVTLTLPVNSTTLTGTGIDPDGTITSYAWTKQSGPAVTLANSNTATLSLSGLVAGTYVLRLTVTDNSGATGTDDVTVLVKPATATPIATAGADISITLPANTATLTGSGTDNDGTIASYAWTKQSGPAATLTNANTASLSLSSLVAGIYVFRLTVTDNTGLTGTDDVTLTVNAAAQAPTANAGNDVNITLPTNSSTLTGSGLDSDGTITTYAWTKQSGPAATLSNANAANVSITGLVAGTYVFRLTVTDNSGLTATDDATVIVNPEVVSGENGINYSYYEGNYSILPNFNSLVAKKTGTGTSFSLNPRDREDQFAFKFDGFIEITTPGQYTFYTTSDDGSKLYINGQQIVNNDYLQGPTERSGTITLTSGRKTIGVTFFEQGGGQVLEVRYQGPGITKQLIPAAVLFRTNSGTTDQAPIVNAGPDVAITLPASTTQLNGSATDADGTIASYAWTKLSGPAAILSNADQPTLSLSGLVAGSYVFRLVATDNTGLSSADEVNLTVNPAVPTGNNGITYSYYEGNYDNIPDFSTLTPVKTGTVSNFVLTPRVFEDYFAFKFDGYIEIATAGEYTFYTASDDGSKLYINGQEIVNNDFLQGTTERSGAITLTPGRKAITVTYFDKTQDNVLLVSYEGPGIPKQEIPNHVLYINGAAARFGNSNDENLTSEVNAFVNPTVVNDHLILNLVNTDNATIVLSDLVGRTYLRDVVTGPKNYISVESLNMGPGMYLLDVKTPDGKNKVIRIIKE